MGGRPGAGPVETVAHEPADWELLADAVAKALTAKGLRKLDEGRRAMEDLPPEEYLALGYYERWIAGIEALLIEKGVVTREEIDVRQEAFEREWGDP
jgi:hypothetical protein